MSTEIPKRRGSGRMLAHVLLTLLLVSSAHAETGTEACRYDRAKRALSEDRLDVALSGFRACLVAAADGPESWRVRLGVALTLQLADEPAGAAMHYRAFLSDSAGHPAVQDPRWQERRDAARKQLEALHPKALETHAWLEVTSDPPGVQLLVDGGPVLPRHRAITPYALYLAPGRHRLGFLHPDHRPQEVELIVIAGQRRTVRSVLEPRPDPLDAPPTPSVLVSQARPAVDRPAEPDDSLRLVAYTGLGVGLAAAIGGGVFTILAASDADEMDRLRAQPPTVDVVAREERLRRRIRGRETASAVLYASGAALVVGAVALVLLTPTDPGEHASGSGWLVEPLPGGVRLAW